MLTLLTIAALAAAQPPAEDNLPRPTPAQAAWHDLEIGMFIHLAPQTWQDGESDKMTTPLHAMNPTELDTDQWVRVAESMGAKYIVFVAKHEGGFCWWPTTTTDYSVRSIPWRGGMGDVMRDLRESCDERAMKLGVYLSPRDRKHGADVGGRMPDAAAQATYEALFRAQLTELLRDYGPMMEVWFDGSLVFGVGDILTAYAPGAVVFQGPQASIRWVGNEDGIAPYPGWNAVRFGAKKWGDYVGADGDPNGDRWLPNECDARLRSTWFWNSFNDDTIKSVKQLMEMYEHSVGRGGVLLLNVTPDTTGRIPDVEAQRVREFGDAVRTIYGTSIADTSGRGVELTVQPSAPSRVDRVVIQEDIRAGERVRAYRLEALVDGVWRAIGSGSAIGHKRIHPIEPITAAAVRLRIGESVGEPRIRRLSLHSSAPGAAK